MGNGGGKPGRRLGRAGAWILIFTMAVFSRSVARAAVPVLPPEVPQGLLTTSESWIVGAVVADSDARLEVRVVRVKAAGQPAEFGVELVLPATSPEDVDVRATVPESAVPGTIDALQSMLAQRKQLESQARDEVVVAYSPIPDLIITLVQRGRTQSAVVFIQGQAVSLPADRGLTQLRDLLQKAQTRIRDLRQQS